MSFLRKLQCIDSATEHYPFRFVHYDPKLQHFTVSFLKLAVGYLILCIIRNKHDIEI